MSPYLLNFNVALEREVSVLPNPYNTGYQYVLQVTCVVTKGDFCNRLGKKVIKRLKVPL